MKNLLKGLDELTEKNTHERVIGLYRAFNSANKNHNKLVDHLRQAIKDYNDLIDKHNRLAEHHAKSIETFKDVINNIDQRLNKLENKTKSGITREKIWDGKK